MIPWSGLWPNHVEHANEMGTSDLHYVGGLSRTEACTKVILDEGGCNRRATIRPNLKPLICGQRRMRETA